MSKPKDKEPKESSSAEKSFDNSYKAQSTLVSQQISSQSSSTEAVQDNRIKASPYAKKLAAEQGVNLEVRKK